MILIYILSLLSLSSVFVDRGQPVQINQEENNIDTFETDKTMKPIEVSNIIQQKSGLNENELSGEVLLEITGEKSDFLENSLDEEYEEIVFQDNFDKEYWSGTEDNYLEE